jgi:hypothetical protein
MINSLTKIRNDLSAEACRRAVTSEIAVSTLKLSP